MKPTAADLLDEISRHADHVLLSLPAEAPALFLLAMRDQAICALVVQAAAVLLRERHHDVACDLILLVDAQARKNRETIGNDEKAREMARDVVARANNRARTLGHSSYIDPSMVFGAWP